MELRDSLSATYGSVVFRKRCKLERPWENQKRKSKLAHLSSVAYVLSFAEKELGDIDISQPMPMVSTETLHGRE